MGDFIGQEGVKQQLSIFLEAARQRGEPLDHVLLAAPSLGQDLAGRNRRRRDGGGLPRHQRAGARAQGGPCGGPHALGARDVLFIDEIHRLTRAVEEILYPAMEDFRST